MSCLKYTSAWSRLLKPALPETAAAMPQERRLGVIHRSSDDCSPPPFDLCRHSGACLLVGERRRVEILKPPYRFDTYRRCRARVR